MEGDYSNGEEITRLDNECLEENTSFQEQLADRRTRDCGFTGCEAESGIPVLQGSVFLGPVEDGVADSLHGLLCVLAGFGTALVQNFQGFFRVRFVV